jgi:hypothetical protein
MQSQQPMTKQAHQFSSSFELDGDTLCSLSSALSRPGSRAPVASLAVIDVILSKACQALHQRTMEAILPNQHTSIFKWLVDIQLDRDGDVNIREWLDSRACEAIQLAQVDLGHVRACHSDSSEVRRATLYIMWDLFVCQQDWALYDGFHAFEITDEMVTRKKYGSWGELEYYRNVLVNQQELAVERKSNSLHRMLTLDSVLRHVFLS